MADDPTAATAATPDVDTSTNDGPTAPAAKPSEKKGGKGTLRFILVLVTIVILALILKPGDTPSKTTEVAAVDQTTAAEVDDEEVSEYDISWQDAKEWSENERDFAVKLGKTIEPEPAPVVIKSTSVILAEGFDSLSAELEELSAKEELSEVDKVRKTQLLAAMAAYLSGKADTRMADSHTFSMELDPETGQMVRVRTGDMIGVQERIADATEELVATGNRQVETLDSLVQAQAGTGFEVRRVADSVTLSEDGRVGDLLTALLNGQNHQQTVDVQLPANVPAIAMPTATIAVTPIDSGEDTARIVISDEDPVMDMGTDVVSGLGLPVIEVESKEELLRIMRNRTSGGRKWSLYESQSKPPIPIVGQVVKYKDLYYYQIDPIATPGMNETWSAIADSTGQVNIQPRR